MSFSVGAALKKVAWGTTQEPVPLIDFLKSQTVKTWQKQIDTNT